jgi:two-component sensor histidine kinase
LDDFVFLAHYSLIGAAALTFSQSSLWDMNWWSWHLLRVMGYAVAMIFAFRSHLKDHFTLLRRKDDLQEQVRERTQQLENSLEEKELLLEEIHHRVKNNLQIVNSLLNLQSNQAEEERQDPFEESKNRIRSIALVHEYLYESESLRDLNFKEYSEGLIDQLLSSLVSDDFDLNLRKEIEEIRLNLDETVQCGLILNEALTNCFKHAFVNRGEGMVRIRFVTAGQRHVLTIADDGVGLPEDNPDELTDTLGLDLIRTLVEVDLNGSLTIDSGSDGTTVTVAFPGEGP